MATLRTTLNADTNTIAAFRAWASYISGAFSTFGWVQSSDTGQAVWTAITCNITNAVASGGFATYTFNSATASLRNGMSIAVTGCITGAFNITGNIVNLSGTTSGTFQLVLGGTIGPEVETATGTVALVPTAVGSGGTFWAYEVWKANDSLAATYPFYCRIDYGQNSNAGVPMIGITIGRGSTGAGVLTTAIPQIISGTAFSGVATAGLDSIFSGDSGRMQMFPWRNWNSTNLQPYISVERSVDSAGTPNGDFIHASMGCWPGAGAWRSNWVTSTGIVGTQRGTQETNNNNDASTAFGGYISVSPSRPVIGYERNPLLGLMRGALNDWNDGDVVNISIYTGVPHTYFCTKNTAGNLISKTIGGVVNGNNVLLMRYD